MKAPDMTVLVETLRFAVPLHIIELRTVREQHRIARAHSAAAAIATYGDILQYGGKTPASRSRIAGTFNQLAEGLACLAYQPGGVEFKGIHWCVWTHPGGAEGVTGCTGGA